MDHTYTEHSRRARGVITTLALAAGALCISGGAAYAHDGVAGHLHVAQGPASMPSSRPTGQPAYTGHSAAEAAAFHGMTHAVAILRPTEGNTVAGTVHFTVMGGQIHVSARVTGLEPNTSHGFHLHEYGDCSAANGKSAGGHYNPEGHAHALPKSAMRHAGDLGNLNANAKGEARYEGMIDTISIAGMRNPIIGRAVIVHAKPDDGGQPTGNAGSRVACGVIGIQKPAK